MSVSTSGYYQWLSRKPSKRAIDNARIDDTIQRIYTAHKGRYGAPRITVELNKQDNSASLNRVARRMKHLKLRAKQAKRFKATTDSSHRYPVFGNKLTQDFSARGMNEKWVTDITAIWTPTGWLYLCVFIDCYHRQVIGWSMSSRMKKSLVCDALLMALWKTGFPKEVIVHSDRGSQYCSHHYRQLLKDNHLFGSMSAKGCCYDNALAESFFHTLKVECIHGESIQSRESARQIIFEYIESYYNRVRQHSALGFQSPVEFLNAS